MPPRDPSLPEGTDHIIDTNIDLGDTGGGSGGAGTGAGGSGGGGNAAMGSAGTGGATGSTGGSTGGGGSGSTGASSGGGSAFQFDKSSGGGSSGGGVSGIAGQVREQINTFKSQAGDRARGFAEDGKSQATDFLQTIAQVVADAAGSVEERLGGQYAGVGRRASDSISALASSLDQRSVDDLIEDARAFVQKSPAAAIGIAAVLGFAVARVARISIAEFRGGTENDGGGGTGRAGTVPDTSPALGTGGLNATSGAFGETGAGTAGNMGGTGTSSGAGSTGAGGSAPTY
jgi:ElaB/YqjD/DUF883 family membrane-anchored ribosome-binding protein